MATSAKGLRVYGWTDFRPQQVRAIMAARSWAEVSRASGISVQALRKYGATTGNATEVRAAMATPGVVLSRPLDDDASPFTE